MASEPPKVFISYNRADRDLVEWDYRSNRTEAMPLTLPCLMSLHACS